MIRRTYSLQSVVLFISLVIGSFSCTVNKAVNSNNSAYPPELNAVFNVHGGLDKWNSLKGMSYEIVKEPENEKQIIDLADRRERITGSNFIMGYDGDDYWIEADTSYKGNPVFYKNLMFYFYAMPFVLADEGIIYSVAKPLELDGQSYPGIAISYKSDVGVSPEDEYFIHYDPRDYKMAWLGYTVTYFTKEQSKQIKWIKYDDWQSVNNVILPKSLAWYKLDENGMPVEERNRLVFDKLRITTDPFTDAVFSKTNNAKIVSPD